MPNQDRAAQFAPFAALTGFDEAIAETGRMTDEKVILDECEMAALSDKLNEIRAGISLRPVVWLEYFQADEKKSGGAYVTIKEPIQAVDEYQRVVITCKGTRIRIDDILHIEFD